MVKTTDTSDNEQRLIESCLPVHLQSRCFDKLSISDNRPTQTQMNIGKEELRRPNRLPRTQRKPSAARIACAAASACYMATQLQKLPTTTIHNKAHR